MYVLLKYFSNFTVYLMFQNLYFNWQVYGGKIQCIYQTLFNLFITLYSIYLWLTRNKWYLRKKRMVVLLDYREFTYKWCYQKYCKILMCIFMHLYQSDTFLRNVYAFVSNRVYLKRFFGWLMRFRMFRNIKLIITNHKTLLIYLFDII